MTYSQTFFCLILLLSFVFSVNPVLADTESSSGSSDPYQDLKASVSQDLKHLQELGGGIKPFEARIADLDQMKSNGQADAAMSQLTSLSSSVKEQLKSVSELRAHKPAPKAKVASGARPTTTDMIALFTSSPKSFDQNISSSQAQQLQQMFSDTNFQGNGNEYIQKVAQDIIAREFGGLGIPCRGPFQLERFRNLHRMNELRKQGRDIKNFLTYHNQTEQLAARASREPGIVAELSQRVRYLEQQLGMAPLTGSNGIRQF